MKALEKVPPQEEPLAGRTSWAGRPSRRRRALTTVGVIVLMVALVAATWAVATVFQSPAQREADASAPAPQPVFSAVVTGSLADQRSYSGTVAYSSETGFTLTASDDARSVVTGEPALAGSELHSGDLLTEVNTRPVFLVASPFDFFRDIGFGDEGADVRVLQDALVGLGYLNYSDERYGAQTALAVARWYRDAGYVAPTRARDSTAASESFDATGGTVGSGPSSESGMSSESDASAESGESGSGAAPTRVVDAFVPLNELLAIPSLPATIIAAPPIGADVGGDTSDLTLGTDTLIVRAEVPATEAAGMEPGDEVVVVSDSGQVDAVVASNASQPPDQDGVPRPNVLTVAFKTDPAVLASERGATVNVQVQLAVIAGESLIVPTAAVVGRGDGRGIVVKRQADGTLVEVLVAVEGSLRGMTAVAPDRVEVLVEGDEVRVG